MHNEVEKEFLSVGEMLHKTGLILLNNMPSILVAILVFFIGLYAVRYISKLATRIISSRSKDQLVTDFLVNIISFVLIVLLTVLCMGILGWGSITDKILAGAGITTFVVGFALKDIGENFLAGIIMAFRRPFKVGDLVEIENIRGRVMKMTLRDTLLKTSDGRDVFIPNSVILKNPFENFTVDNVLRNEFLIHVVLDDVEETQKTILSIIKNNENTVDSPAPNVLIESLENDRVTLKTLYWYKTTDISAPGGTLRTEILNEVIRAIKTKIYK